MSFYMPTPYPYTDRLRIGDQLCIDYRHTANRHWTLATRTIRMITTTYISYDRQCHDESTSNPDGQWRETIERLLRNGEWFVKYGVPDHVRLPEGV